MATCNGCRWLAMTWAKSRRCYAKLVAHGLTARGPSKSPLCHNCAGEQHAGGQQMRGELGWV
jgi:hypothetical protein